MRPRLIGNDIVCWDSAENRGRSSNRRFVERVFTPSEQKAIADSPQPDLTLWSLWAVKEAAFKIAVKLDPSTVFSPVRFSVSFDAHPGTIAFLTFRWPFWWVQTADWVHAWALTDDTGPAPELSVAHVGGDESAGVRRLAVELLAGRGLRDCRIEGRPPRVWQNDAPAAGDLSLSHDGGYGAAAWLSGVSRTS